MTTTYSTSLKLALIGSGEQSGIWGNTTNTNLGTLLEQAITGVQTITMANANYTLTNLNGVSDEARNAVLVIQGANSAVRQIVAPLVEKFYTISNQTTGGYAVTIGGSSGLTVSIPNGTTGQVYCDGSNFYSAMTTSAGNYTISGDLTVAGTINAQGSSNIVPAGSLMMWPTGTAPSGYLLCTGTAVSRTTYAALFAIIGTTFGAGDGSTTFNVPNYTNRMPYGTTVGATGGSADATLVSHSHTFSGSTGTMSANAVHNHTVNDPGHAHQQQAYASDSQAGNQGIPRGGREDVAYGATNPPTVGAGTGIYLSNTNTDHTHGYSGTTSTQGNSATNANLPPYLGINFIIKI